MLYSCMPRQYRESHHTGACLGDTMEADYGAGPKRSSSDACSTPVTCTPILLLRAAMLHAKSIRPSVARTRLGVQRTRRVVLYTQHVCKTR